MTRFNPDQKEIRCKKSSLAIYIDEKEDNWLEIIVYNRQTHDIINIYRVPLFFRQQNIEPIKKRTSKYAGHPK